MSEKRRHVRVEHRDVVRFDAAGTTFEGTSVDISRNGMQVEIAVPQSFDRVDMIRFSLSEQSAELAVPVRIARRGEEADDGGQQTLAFEFLHGADQQIRLIENYIRDFRERQGVFPDAEPDTRRIPRLDCELHAECSTGLRRVIIENISLEGLLISAEGFTATGTVLAAAFEIPPDGRRVNAQCRVVYVVRDSAGRRIRFGARFTGLSQVQRARISGYIEATTASRSLRSVRSLIMDRDDAGYWLDRDQSALLLQEAEGALFYLLPEGERTIYHAQSEGLEEPEPLGCLRLALEGAVTVRGSQAVFLSFAFQGSNHYFSSLVRSVGPIGEDGKTRILVEQPHRVHRTDNRSAHRKRITEASGITVYPGGEELGGPGIPGELVDISWRGFLCEVRPGAIEQRSLKPGTPLAYRVDPRYGLMNHGRVRHVSSVRKRGAGQVLQIGVEAGVRRGEYRKRIISTSQWEREVVHQKARARSPMPGCVSQRVTYRNRRGETIVALINRAGPGDEPVVILIPPAFGKKKETMAPLAATLCYNFALAGRSVAVIRYDGINRPGESFNQTDRPARGYEMLHYRPSQGVEDMRTSLDYVYDNPGFRPSGVILVTSSMSSVDARKFLLGAGGRVTAWVSLMGVPAARTTLTNVLAGTDIVANYKLNVPNGVRGMLGHLVDMDLLARDLIEQKYAYLADARFDLARIDLPLFWIVGEHDHWVNPDEVDDIMSVESGARRELVQIPTGHNLRNSDDAAEAFRMIAEFCAETAGVELSASCPPRDAVLSMIAREREAVFQPFDSVQVSAYWHSYLLGNRHGSEGYDFYDKLGDFRRFLTTEAELLDPRPGQTIADIGCGTGLLTREILRLLAARRGERADGGPTEIVAMDLVPEALERAGEKCRALVARERALDEVAMHFEVRNLEPNRLLPLRDFIKHRELMPEYLAGRIEGLPDSVVQEWQDNRTADLVAYLRGDLAAPVLRIPGEAHAVELNRASRFIRGQLRADDLHFKLLNFGSCALPEEEASSPGVYDSVAASLFISYILNPDYLLCALHRTMRPGGRILLSSMRPDSDISKIFTDFIHEQSGKTKDSAQLAAARAMLNEAAGLFELEEDGYFRFYSGQELRDLLEQAGFRDVSVVASLGDPTQAIIATGIATADPPQPWSSRV